MRLSSPNFKNGAIMPAEFTCDGANISPALIIEDVPAEAKSLALIADDPDAPMGTWVHWVVWNISPKIKQTAKGAKAGIEGTNDFGRKGYGGPCPPSGIHRYYFKLYALDTSLSLDASATKAKLEQAMQNHIIAKAELMGKYSRS